MRHQIAKMSPHSRGTVLEDILRIVKDMEIIRWLRETEDEYFNENENEYYVGYISNTRCNPGRKLVLTGRGCWLEKQALSSTAVSSKLGENY